MTTTKEWVRKPRATYSWQHLHATESDNGERWRVVWDTMRKPEAEGRNIALETSKAGALERARHMLRMGFIVYEIREPAGAIFLDEEAIRQQFGLQPAAR